jgi:hypothetical protein
MNEEIFYYFAKIVFGSDAQGLKDLQSILMSIVKDSRYMNWMSRKNKELLRKCIQVQLVYFYLQVEEHFNGDYSREIFIADQSKSFDAQFALLTYHAYSILCHDLNSKKQSNLLQVNNPNNIFYPSYFTLVSSFIKAIKS